MIPRPPRATRTDTLFPYTTLFRSPKRTALLEAAATAAVALCLDERVGFTEDGEPGPWHEDYSAWVGARIRKVSRRARGAQWLAAQEVPRSEEHTSELQSLMRISYAVFCLKKKKNTE